jgi:GMP synthase-like glutamine amidotransferase
MTPRPLRLAVIQHQSDAPPGLLGDWAAGRGLDVTVLRGDRGARLPEPPAVDLVAVLGAYARAVPGARDWVDRELGWLTRLAGAGVPVLGICFGAQALAVALGGGGVRRAERLEVGWVAVDGLVDSGPWFAFHEDVIEPPPGATVLGHNDVGLQAFSAGRNLGVQFHPEVTPAMVDAWAARRVLDLALAGVAPAELCAETEERAPWAAAAARRLFDTFLRRALTLQLDPAPARPARRAKLSLTR